MQINMDVTNRDLLKLNFSESPAYYSTVLYKYNSPAAFCEKTPKKALSNTPPPRFVGILFTFTSSSRTCSPAKKSLGISRPQNWFQQLLKNNFFSFLSYANTIQGTAVVNSLRPCLVSCRK